jgi:hypothetical protein
MTSGTFALLPQLYSRCGTVTRNLQVVLTVPAPAGILSEGLQARFGKAQGL